MALIKINPLIIPALADGFILNARSFDGWANRSGTIGGSVQPQSIFIIAGWRVDSPVVNRFFRMFRGEIGFVMHDVISPGTIIASATLKVYSNEQTLENAGTGNWNLGEQTVLTEMANQTTPGVITVSDWNKDASTRLAPDQPWSNISGADIQHSFPLNATGITLLQTKLDASTPIMFSLRSLADFTGSAPTQSPTWNDDTSNQIRYWSVDAPGVPAGSKPVLEIIIPGETMEGFTTVEGLSSITF